MGLNDQIEIELTKLEVVNFEAYQETVIITEGNQTTWSVSTGQTVWKNRLAKLAEAHPDDVVCRAVNEDGSVMYSVPRTWVSIRKPRESTMSEEQKAKGAERLRAYHAQKIAQD